MPMSSVHTTGVTRYSICIINFNTARTVKQSLLSILNQVSDDFEVIVVDSCSKDGSTEILREYERRGLIRLIVTNCTRGRGRQIGFEQSRGQYVISQMDLDTIYKPALRKLLDIYHENFEGSILIGPGFLIGHRRLLEELGGWRDLQYAEDRDLWSRAARIGMLRFLPHNVMVEAHLRDPERATWRSRIRERYVACRDLYRLGMKPRKAPAETYAFHIIRFVAWLTYRFKQCYRDPFNRTFGIKKYAVRVKW